MTRNLITTYVNVSKQHCPLFVLLQSISPSWFCGSIRKKWITPNFIPKVKLKSLLAKITEDLRIWPTSTDTSWCFSKGLRSFSWTSVEVYRELKLCVQSSKKIMLNWGKLLDILLFFILHFKFLKWKVIKLSRCFNVCLLQALFFKKNRKSIFQIISFSNTPRCLSLSKNHF